MIRCAIHLATNIHHSVFNQKKKGSIYIKKMSEMKYAVMKSLTLRALKVDKRVPSRLVGIILAYLEEN